MDTTPFKNLIKERTGLTLDKASPDILAHEIRNFMLLRGIASPSEYLKLILRDQKEFLKLLNLLTINETYFFREPVYIELFIRRLIPELLKSAGPGRRINILSAGCSTGEEPYSLAIALMEEFGMKQYHLFSITGIDIDNDAIEKAQKGIYGGHSFRSIKSDLKNKYFDNIENNRYKIKDIIKTSIRFQNGNLLDKSQLESLRGSDIIFYRNVSIYFEKEIQERIFRNLSEILNEEGYLIVSSTETLSHSLNILSLIEMDGVFLFHKGDRYGKMPVSCPLPVKSFHKKEMLSNGKKIKKELPLPVMPDNGDKEILFPALSKFSSLNKSREDDKILNQDNDKNQVVNQSIEIFFNKALTLAKIKNYKKAFEILDELIEKEPFFIKGYTLKSGILINLQETGQAKKICINIIEKDPLCMEGYLLLGLIARIENNREEALKRFKETLYICPSTWLAHFYLAELYQAGGENEQAEREYQIVMKLLNQGLFNEHGLTFFPFSFSEENIMHLCRYNTEKLSGKF